MHLKINFISKKKFKRIFNSFLMIIIELEEKKIRFKKFNKNKLLYLHLIFLNINNNNNRKKSSATNQDYLRQQREYI